MAEQHVCWQEQFRNALNVQQPGFERAAQEYEQAVRDEVHVAVAQVAQMSRAEMRTRMGALEIPVQETWTSHKVVLLDWMTTGVSQLASKNPEMTVF